MAFKKTNEAVKVNSGKVGNIRYYVKSGKTYSRSASSLVSNPRTLEQMKVRCRMANMQHCHEVLSHYLKKGFEGADKSVSVYNLFIGNSSYALPIYLTKQQKIQGYAIAAPYCVSSGSLAPVMYELDGDILKSDIAIGNLDLNAATVGQLARAIISSDPRWKYGDNLSFIGLQQIEIMGTPYVKAVASTIRLEKDSQVPVPQEMGFMLNDDGCLAASVEGLAGCYAWVHARTESDRISTQFLANCNPTLVEQYSSDEQLIAAAESYGEIDEEAFYFSNGNGEAPEGMYRLTVQSQDTNKGTVTGGGLYAEGDNATFDAYPKAGYEFAGWYRGSEKFSDEAHVTEFDMPAANITVTAKFVQRTHVTVKLVAGADGKVGFADGEMSTTAIAQVQIGGSITCKAQPDSGHVFQSWSDGDEQATRTLTNVTEDIELTASFI